MLPQFKKSTDAKNAKLVYGFDKLVDLLTMIDPAKRPNCAQSLKMLDSIRLNFQIDMEIGQNSEAYY